MHGPEELLALLKVMLLTARPVLSIVETQYLPSQQDESNETKKSYAYFFFFGDITIIICRPSIFGNCSTTAMSSKSFSIRFN